MSTINNGQISNQDRGGGNKRKNEKLFSSVIISPEDVRGGANAGLDKIESFVSPLTPAWVVRHEPCSNVKLDITNEEQNLQKNKKCKIDNAPALYEKDLSVKNTQVTINNRLKPIRHVQIENEIAEFQLAATIAKINQSDLRLQTLENLMNQTVQRGERTIPRGFDVTPGADAFLSDLEMFSIQITIGDRSYRKLMSPGYKFLELSKFVYSKTKMLCLDYYFVMGGQIVNSETYFYEDCVVTVRIRGRGGVRAKNSNAEEMTDSTRKSALKMFISEIEGNSTPVQQAKMNTYYRYHRNEMDQMYADLLRDQYPKRLKVTKKLLKKPLKVVRKSCDSDKGKEEQSLESSEDLKVESEKTYHHNKKNKKSQKTFRRTIENGILQASKEIGKASESEVPNPSGKVLNFTPHVFDWEEETPSYPFTKETVIVKLRIPEWLMIEVNRFLSYAATDFYLSILWNKVSQDPIVSAYLDTVPEEYSNLMIVARKYFLAKKRIMALDNLSISKVSEKYLYQDEQSRQILRNPKPSKMSHTVSSLINATGIIDYYLWFVNYVLSFFIDMVRPLRTALLGRTIVRNQARHYPNANIPVDPIRQTRNAFTYFNWVVPETPYSILPIPAWISAYWEELVKCIPGMCYVIGFLDALFSLDYNKYLWHVKSMWLPFKQRLKIHLRLNSEPAVPLPLLLICGFLLLSKSQLVTCISEMSWMNQFVQHLIVFISMIPLWTLKFLVVRFLYFLKMKLSRKFLLVCLLLVIYKILILGMTITYMQVAFLSSMVSLQWHALPTLLITLLLLWNLGWSGCLVTIQIGTFLNPWFPYFPQLVLFSLLGLKKITEYFSNLDRVRRDQSMPAANWW
jgi:hypothetical protein